MKIYGVLTCVLCYLSLVAARPKEKKHGTLYNDPGFIGYWRPPRQVPPSSTQKTLSSQSKDSADSSKDTVTHTIKTIKLQSHIKSSSVQVPKGKNEIHLSDDILLHSNERNNNQDNVNIGEIKKPGSLSRIENKYDIESRTTKSKWTEKMQALIQEVYGGQLPYSDAEEIQDDLVSVEELPSKKGPSKKKESDHDVDVSSRFISTTGHKKNTNQNVQVQNEKPEEHGAHNSMMRVIKKVQKQSKKHSAGLLKHIKSKKEKNDKQSRRHQVNKAGDSEEIISNTPLVKTKVHDFLGAKVMSTTAAPSTRPNPPTTKQAKVTPMSHNKADKKYILSRPYETCADDMGCSSGRVCYLGACVCGDETLCRKHSKPVCGSNGIVYPSHCELHRNACLTQIHIRIDDGKACEKQRKQSTQPSGQQEKTLRGVRCEYHIREKTGGVLWGQQLVSTTEQSRDSCLEKCEKDFQNCLGFEFSSKNGHCAKFDRGQEIEFWPNDLMNFYEIKRCKHVLAQECGFEQIKLNTDTMYVMCDVSVITAPNLAVCETSCHDCKAFTYQSYGGVCEIYHDDACVAMLKEQIKSYYVRHCHSDGNVTSCHILEVTPGQSPYMCSKATSNMTSLLDCHDTCLRGHCEAFRFKKNGVCEIFFDKSCVGMLKSGRENYYIRRCTNPKDCSYEQMKTISNAPCGMTSNSLKTFEECRDACDDCFGFKYDYDTGFCNLYQEASCITNKKVNYMKRDCSIHPDLSSYQASLTHKEKLLHRVKRPDNAPLNPMLDDAADKLQEPGEKKEGHKIHQQLPEHEDEVHNLQAEKTEEHKVDHVVPDLKSKEHWKKLDTEKSEKSKSNASGPKNKLLLPTIQEETDGKVLKDKAEETMFSEICTTQEYVQMKADILRYHCVRYQESDCSPTALYSKKDYIASLMFSYYDRNMDNKIVRDELWQIWITEPFQKMFSSCSLLDMFKFETISDDVIKEEAFVNAFGIPLSSLQEEIQEIDTLATVGNGLELRCGISPSSENSQIVWKRHGTDMESISFPGIAVFSDGTLYFENVGIHHIGNWTCHDYDKPGFKQVHVLKIHMPPKVRVSPSSQMLPMSHIDVYLHCHSTGIPEPTIQWEFNDRTIPVKPDHYLRIHDNGTLIIRDSSYARDSGAYKCNAKNVAGNSQDIAMVYIKKPNDTDKYRGSHIPRQESFLVFHQNGYTAYNPEGCYTRRVVTESFGNLKYIPEQLDSPLYLCKTKEQCQWGHAVNVKNKFIYVAQPTENRLVVIDAVSTMNPVEFVSTDKFPVKLFYVEHLDQVWVLCWNAEKSTGSKTIVVIRDASVDMRHHMVHTQPIGYRFDLVQDLFLPSGNDLNHNPRYGYVIHNEQRGLFKIELESMRYTKAIDLSIFDCIPQEMAYVPLGGHVIVQCLKRIPTGSETMQILLDYITDVPVANISLDGTPYITPDSKHVITIDKVNGQLRIAKVALSGKITKLFDVATGSAISDAAFFPSENHKGYDLFLTSRLSDEIFFVSLSNGKVITIKDVGQPRHTKIFPFSPSPRSIIGGDVFSKFLASPAQDSLIVLNGKHYDTACRFPNLKNPNTVAFNVAPLA